MRAVASAADELDALSAERVDHLQRGSLVNRVHRSAADHRRLVRVQGAVLERAEGRHDGNGRGLAGGEHGAEETGDERHGDSPMRTPTIRGVREV